MTVASSPEVLEQLSGTYQLDPAHTRVGFAARYVAVTTVRGSFGSFEGRLDLDAGDPTKSSVTLTIDAASIQTGNSDRDAHLRSGDFFDVERYPTLTFVSTSVTPSKKDRYRVTGDLTIKEVTRPVEIELTYGGNCVDPYNQHRVGFEGSASIQRSEWGLTWNAALEAGGVVLSDRIDLDFDISAIKTD